MSRAKVPSDHAERGWDCRHPTRLGRSARLFAYTCAFMGTSAERNLRCPCTDHHWTTARATWSHNGVGRSGTAILTTQRSWAVSRNHSAAPKSKPKLPAWRNGNPACLRSPHKSAAICFVCFSSSIRCGAKVTYRPWAKYSSADEPDKAEAK